MPKIPGFVGPTYTAQSPWADAERCVNLIPSVVDGGTPQMRVVYDPAPGLSVFRNFDDVPGYIRGEVEINGRFFVVCGERLIEVSSAGRALSNAGPLLNDGQPVSISSSQTQLFIVSGGLGYSYDLATNTFAPIMVTDVVSALSIESDGLSITRTQPLIVGISQADTIVTVALLEAVPFRVGQNVTLSGVTPSGFNGTFAVRSVSGNSFTCVNPTTGLVGWATGVANKGSTQNVPIVSLTWAADVVTITTATNLDTSAPQEITISGCSVAAHNGTFTLVAAPSGATCQRSSLVATTQDYRPTANAGDYDNTASAYDASNGTTYAEGTVDGPDVEPADSKSVTYSGFAAATITSGTLSVYSSATGGGSPRGAVVEYNLGDGWQVLYRTTASRTGQTDLIALPAGQDLSQIQVRASCAAGPTPTYATQSHRVYDIKINATVAVGSAPTNVAGGLSTAYTLDIVLAPTTASIPSVGQELTVAGATLADYDDDYTVMATALVNTAGVENAHLYCDSTLAAYGRAASGGGTATIFGSVQVPAVLGQYCDSYFIRLVADSKRWGVSALLDCTAWDLSDVTKVSVFPDDVVSLLVDHRDVWVFGRSKTVVYGDSGNLFPFDVVSGGYIEQGCAARLSPVRLDNSIFWLGQDDRGGRMAWRANGYGSPKRVSNHATEYAWQQYSTVADAVSWSYQENGHTFWVLQFPTASATWVFDASTDMWTERGYWNGFGYEAHLGICHAYAFGKHLVGSRLDGKVYQLSTANPTDAGTVIRWTRRFPWIADVGKWVTHHKLQIAAEAGLAVGAIEPTITLRWSDDGCHTWSNEYSLSLGTLGQYVKRAVKYALGRSRARTYEISGTTPVRLLDAYLNEPDN